MGRTHDLLCLRCLAWWSPMDMDECPCEASDVAEAEDEMRAGQTIASADLRAALD